VINIGEARRKAAVSVRWASWATLALLAFIIWVHWKSVHNQVVGSPSRDQVTGTWGGDYGFGLVLHPDGTFTSDALPPHIGTAAPEPSQKTGNVEGAWPARGTWTIGPGHLGSSAESVIFTVDCTASGIRCADHPATFELQLETNSPQGGGGPALFYFLDRTHDLNNQYPFVRVPS
jgi:hypothetical protein